MLCTKQTALSRCFSKYKFSHQTSVDVTRTGDSLQILAIKRLLCVYETVRSSQLLGLEMEWPLQLSYNFKLPESGSASTTKHRPDLSTLLLEWSDDTALIQGLICFKSEEVNFYCLLLYNFLHYSVKQQISVFSSCLPIIPSSTPISSQLARHEPFYLQLQFIILNNADADRLGFPSLRNSGHCKTPQMTPLQHPDTDGMTGVLS